ncbi:MAG: dethiobiotin synthase [Pseudonocardiales bacterium]|nr:MAG: dethiobiotin synthase [Pseudonocardiales bacterium]
MAVLIVTGTGTDVGKTVVTAALAACARGSVAVVKLAQTGVTPGEPGDLAEITRLSGCTNVHEFARYPAPLSPHHAALESGLPALEQGDAVMRIAELELDNDLVLVEGSGGLLVPYQEPEHWTIYDLGVELAAEYVLVTSAGLGTINHTTLTVNAIEESRDRAAIIIGSWPAQPGLAERCNVVDLGMMGRKSHLDGVLPQGLPAMTDFAQRARAALAPKFGGTFDWLAFRAAARPTLGAT